MSLTTEKKKAMFNTKDMTAGSGKIRPVLDPGNHNIKINDLTFDQTPYDKDAYNITLHVESEPVKGEFEGFLVNKEDASGPRYKGQVGRVRLSPWPYKDAELPSGRKVSRDTEVMKAMINLSEALGNRAELDMIEADTIEEFMVSCRALLSNGDVWLNTCIGSREWENNDGYINNDLYLPRMNKTGSPYANVENTNGNVMTFNREEHVRPVKKKEGVNSFEPTGGSSDDFEL